MEIGIGPAQVKIEDEMQNFVPRLRDERDRVAGAAGRPRWTEAVQRRILVAMHDLNLAPNRAYRKCAKIAGDTSGNYHPHGEAVIYPTLVRMAQDFNMRYPLVDGQGNFGSVDGDPPAAMRYTEARLTPLAMEMLADLDMDTVDWVANYDHARRSRRSCPAASRTCSATARRASRSAWRRISRRTTSARLSTRSCT